MIITERRENMIKKFLKGLMIVMMVVGITACGNSTPKDTDENKVKTIGDVITLKNFEVELLNYSLRNALKENEKHQQLIFIEINATNTSSSDQTFSSGLYTAYNPNNIKLDKITSSQYSTSISSLGRIRSGGTTNGHIIIPFDGYGKYYIEFTAKKGTVLVEFTIYENQE